MNLFIEDPHRAGSVLAAGEDRCAEPLHRGAVARTGVDVESPRRASERGAAPGALAQEAYREALAYEDARSTSAKRFRIARVIAAVALAPIVVVLVFIASYALTCIVNGASPEELVLLMGDLFTRVAEFVRELAESV